MLQVLDPNDHEDGPENLLPVDPHLGPDVIEHAAAEGGHDGHAEDAHGAADDHAVALVLGLSFESEFDLSFEWPVHGWLVLLALVAQVIGWPIIAKAMPHLPALDTSILILGQPMLAMLWAWLIFDEALGVGQLIGVALVMAGLVFFSLSKPDPASDETREERPESVEDPV